LSRKKSAEKEPALQPELVPALQADFVQAAVQHLADGKDVKAVLMMTCKTEDGQFSQKYLAIQLTFDRANGTLLVTMPDQPQERRTFSTMPVTDADRA
jgi:hypothetical protein